MILNLLDNAVKYTDVGGGVHDHSSEKMGVHRLLFLIMVWGISQTDQPRVFDRFYRVDKARSRKLGGAGLGLSIVQWIVDAHAGKIEVESEFGVGSTFMVELPLKRSEDRRGE